MSWQDVISTSYWPSNEISAPREWVRPSQTLEDAEAAPDVAGIFWREKYEGKPSLATKALDASADLGADGRTRKRIILVMVRRHPGESTSWIAKHLVGHGAVSRVVVLKILVALEKDGKVSRKARRHPILRYRHAAWSPT